MLAGAAEFQRLCHVDRMGDISSFKGSLVALLCRDDIKKNKLLV